MGMMNWRKGGDEDDEPADEDEFDLDEGSAVADALDDEWDDGLDDEWGDEFGGGDDALVHDLQDKVNDVESELGSVSSSMKTIKEENKRIAETVDELDDTIRKLLDVYEIVTRGINPFIDDAQAMANMNNEGSFGLFGEVEEQTDDALDPSLAGANAESFFDDDFDDVAPEPDADDAAAGATDDPTDPLGADADAPDDAGSGGGVSFEDLKAEYETAGDEDWEDDDADAAGNEDDEGDAVDDGTDDLDDLDDQDELDDFDDEAFTDAHLDGESTDETVEFDDLEALDEFGGGALGEEDLDDDAFDDDAFDDDGIDTDAFDDATFSDDAFDDATFSDDGIDDATFGDDGIDDTTFDEPSEIGSDPDVPTNGADANGDEQAASTGVDPVGNSRNGGGSVAPGRDGDGDDVDGDYYLGRVPDDYVGELLLMEWAEALVAVGGTPGAMEACRYYERLGWISPAVSDRLSTHVVGSGVAADPDRAGTFVMDDHVRSLGYVSKLGGDPSSLLVEAAAPGGEYGGIRG